MGTKDYPKEEMKIYFDGKIIFLNDYKDLKIFGHTNFSPFTAHRSPGLKTKIIRMKSGSLVSR